ncbi:trypsin-like serine protease [Streptomyces sp. YGL11-2]|uniref:trypsin-like serine protease n=1 Tax=Streptomyces sp. YGL11-2 TaxID=3414028 RepID=UPI003CED87FF
MHFRGKAAAVALGLTFTSIAAPTVSAESRQHNVKSIQEIARMPLAAQQKLLNPLRALAGAVDGTGKRRFASTYSNVYIDAPSNQVVVYVTDLKAGRGLLQEARRAGGDVRLARLERSSYSHAALDAAADQMMKASLRHQIPVDIYAAAVATDGSGVEATVADPASAQSALQQSFAAKGHSSLLNNASHVKITFEKGVPKKPATWSDARWNDKKPFIAGDVLSSVDGNFVHYCTAGMSIVSKGHDFLVTAGHCFRGPDRVQVYTGGGDKGQFDGNTTGANYVGDVVGQEPETDSEIIDSGDGNTSNSDEGDLNSYVPMTSSAYSHAGDLVCQDGAWSYFSGHGVPCGIKVVDDDIRWNLKYDDGETVTVRGVKGTKTDGGWAIHTGDSGGAVFSISGSNERQSRGIMSAEDSEGGPTVYWTETPDILSKWYAQLNPAT